VETDEPLETGYGTATPRGDNLCNDYQQGLAEAYGALAAARGDRVLDDLELMLCDAGSPSLFCNVAVLRRPLSEHQWRVAVARMRWFYRQQQGGDFLIFSAWPTPDLVGQDLVRIGHPPLMLRSPAPLRIDRIDGLTIRPVLDTREAQDWEHVLVHAFPVPELQPPRPGCVLPDSALAAPRWQHWVGYLNGEPVATASVHVGDHHLDVEYISTMLGARGRGIGQALTATATSADPGVPAMLIASDPGRPVYERLGYRAILRYTLWAGHR
jgi:ribosomal protein S18 acetylase RimI-like enzyme